MSANCLDAPERANEAGSKTARPDPHVLDSEAVLTLLQGDVDFLKQLVEIFLEDYPSLLANIREGLQRQEGPRVSRAAHTLCGMVGNFRAQSAFEAARIVETTARAGDLAGAAGAFVSLEKELHQLSAALTELVQVPA